LEPLAQWAIEAAAGNPVDQPLSATASTRKEAAMTAEAAMQRIPVEESSAEGSDY